MKSYAIQPKEEIEKLNSLIDIILMLMVKYLRHLLYAFYIAITLLINLGGENYI